jgi:hypothetical protein
VIASTWRLLVPGPEHVPVCRRHLRDRDTGRP